MSLSCARPKLHLFVNEEGLAVVDKPGSSDGTDGIVIGDTREDISMKR